MSTHVKVRFYRGHVLDEITIPITDAPSKHVAPSLIVSITPVPEPAPAVQDTLKQLEVGAELVVLNRRIDEAANILSECLAFCYLGKYGDEAGRVLSKLRAVQANRPKEQG